jgi:hypothetical protein
MVSRSVDHGAEAIIDIGEVAFRLGELTKNRDHQGRGCDAFVHVSWHTCVECGCL